MPPLPVMNIVRAWARNGFNIQPSQEYYTMQDGFIKEYVAIDRRLQILHRIRLRRTTHKWEYITIRLETREVNVIRPMR